MPVLVEQFYNGGTLNITNSTFDINGDLYGGDVFIIIAVSTLANDTFVGNFATSGGAIYNNGSAVIQAYNSTFVGNSASNGGAIYNYGHSGVVNFVNSTFASNTATMTNGVPGEGGAVFINDGTVILQDSLLAMSGSGGNCAKFNGIFSDSGYNLSDDGSCINGGVGSTTVTPPQLNLGPLQDNGGPTQTILPGQNSAAIDAIPVRLLVQ